MKNILFGFLILSVLLAGCTQVPPGGQTPSISVSDQAVECNTMKIDSVFLDKPGFVVVHEVAADGKPGQVVGNSELLNGSASNVQVDYTGVLTVCFSLPEYIAMLHYDNGDGQYTSLDEDVTVKAGETIVMQRFSNIAQPSGEENGTLTVTVTNPSGEPVENAVVEVFIENQKIASAQTNANGIAVLENLSRDKEWYISAADFENQFQAVSKEIGEQQETNTVELQLQIRSELISLSTNKTSYLPGEEITFELQNDSNQSIFISGRSLARDIFQKTNGTVENVALVDPRISFTAPFPETTEIKAGEKIMQTWSGKGFKKTTIDSYEQMQLFGTFFIKQAYALQVRQAGRFSYLEMPILETQSNEFEISAVDSNQQTVNLTLESDDSGFYQNGTKTSSLNVASGSTINLTIKQRSTNTAWGGADFKSTAFATINIPNGQERMVSFAVNADTKIESFWPGSNVK